MPPRRIEATLYRRDVCELAEGPFWHDGQLWWVDIEGGLLLSANDGGELVERVAFGQRVGAAVPAGKRIFLVALEREIVRLDLDTQKWTTIARPDDMGAAINRFNDGKCDPRGRFVVGAMSQPGFPKSATLYALHADRSLHRLRGEVTLSNGLAWPADGRTMYFIDTPERCVFAYDYDVEAGAVSAERVVLRFSEKDGWPDGMTIDRQGRLWIGFWDGGAARCYDPATGACEAIVPVPCARATSCCFGGPGLDRLFITTASTGLSESERAAQPLAGSVFVCDPGTTGFPTSAFAGA
jgi:sugar lactone lactonase YvrE